MRIFDRRAAVSADCLSSGCPLTARAEITLPRSSTATCTRTSPDARICFAICGYDGIGNSSARPFRTPPFAGRFAGSGFILGVVGVGFGRTTVGVCVGDGVRVGAGVELLSGVGDGEALGCALGLGFGVGVGVRIPVFVFMFESEFVLKFAFALKLKLPSMPRFVFTFVFTLAIFELKFVLMFELSAVSFRKN